MSITDSKTIATSKALKPIKITKAEMDALRCEPVAEQNRPRIYGTSHDGLFSGKNPAFTKEDGFMVTRNLQTSYWREEVAFEGDKKENMWIAHTGWHIVEKGSSVFYFASDYVNCEHWKQLGETASRIFSAKNRHRELPGLEPITCTRYLFHNLLESTFNLMEIHTFGEFCKFLQQPDTPPQYHDNQEQRSRPQRFFKKPAVKIHIDSKKSKVKGLFDDIDDSGSFIGRASSDDERSEEGEVSSEKSHAKKKEKKKKRAPDREMSPKRQKKESPTKQEVMSKSIKKVESPPATPEPTPEEDTKKRKASSSKKEPPAKKQEVVAEKPVQQIESKFVFEPFVRKEFTAMLKKLNEDDLEGYNTLLREVFTTTFKPTYNFKFLRTNQDIDVQALYVLMMALETVHPTFFEKNDDVSASPALDDMVNSVMAWRTASKETRRSMSAKLQEVFTAAIAELQEADKQPNPEEVWAEVLEQELSIEEWLEIFNTERSFVYCIKQFLDTRPSLYNPIDWMNDESYEGPREENILFKAAGHFVPAKKTKRMWTK
jgi:hypothetical protein